MLTGELRNQINNIWDAFWSGGIMDATLLYESPFTDITPTGPDGLFTSAQVDELVLLLDEVHARAVTSA
jgi:type I restriction enzyme, R subunit